MPGVFNYRDKEGCFVRDDAPPDKGSAASAVSAGGSHDFMHFLLPGKDVIVFIPF